MKRRKCIGYWLLILLATVAFSATAYAEGGTKEGITVHGHWKIEIFNPDGTRANVTEFDNALLNVENIPNLLAGLYVNSAWRVLLAVDDTGGTRIFWKIGEANTFYDDGTLHSGDLTLSVPQSNTLRLYGSITAPIEADIVHVTTAQQLCNELSGDYTTISPADCRAGNKTSADGLSVVSFTGTALPTPVPHVVPGQLIQVTVDISFS